MIRKKATKLWYREGMALFREEGVFHTSKPLSYWKYYSCSGKDNALKKKTKAPMENRRGGVGGVELQHVSYGQRDPLTFQPRVLLTNLFNMFWMIFALHLCRKEKQPFWSFFRREKNRRKKNGRLRRILHSSTRKKKQKKRAARLVEADFCCLHFQCYKRLGKTRGPSFCTAAACCMLSHQRHQRPYALPYTSFLSVAVHLGTTRCKLQSILRFFDACYDSGAVYLFLAKMFFSE